MDLETLTKMNKMTVAASQIAIVLPDQLTMDVLCAGLAIQRKLTASGSRQATIFSSSKKIPQVEFVNNLPKIHSSFGANNNLTIKVSGQRVKPKQLRYEKQQDNLLIYITPEIAEESTPGENLFKSSDVEVLPPMTGFDLLIILGADNLESLGSLYEQNPQIFYTTAKIAISNKIEQEYFATMTWVETDSPSLSQQVADWFIRDDLTILKDDFVATCLLAGIISATQSFSDPKTTPDTLSIASRLVTNGARRQDIIKYLFKTKPFNLLQLWGRALARIKTFQNNTILYTVITTQDFSKTDTTLEILPQVLSEIIAMANNYKLIILAAEVTSGVDLLFAGPPHVKIKQIAKGIDPTFTGQAENLVGNYQYLTLNLPNFKLEDLDQVVSTLGATGI